MLLFAHFLIMILHRNHQINLLFFSILLLCFGACRNNEKDAKTSIVQHELYPSSFSFRTLENNEVLDYRKQIKQLYDTLLVNTGFNGSILVAKNGQILFEDYRGYSNFVTKDTITAETPLHLASTSKTFTAMSILKLWEGHKLSLDDSLEKYFKGFPYKGITIRSLLSHRSGLPNYLHAMTDWNQNIKMTNTDVLNYFIEKQPPIAWPPNTHFNYCNTNYVFLALIIEQITGKALKEYLSESIFKPLGMKHTYLFTMTDSLQYMPTLSVNKPFLMDAFDYTYGDKNIYSTPRDLLLWDKAMYEHSFVHKETTDMAFTPMSNEKESMHNYGLGWRLFYSNGDTLVYHNGKWHGSNILFNRWVQDTATVIVLGNKTNYNIYDMKMAGSIFTGHADTTRLGE